MATIKSTVDKIFTDNIYNVNRIDEILDNKYFIAEVNLLNSNLTLIRYYKEIIDNVEINKNNPNNSYIMWIFNKVDIIDKNRDVNIKVGNVSLPDVDMDFEKNGRERVIKYVRDKYGHDRVGQIITFNRMQGRGALKDVNRAHDVLDEETINRITSLLPKSEAEIADQLEAIKEEDKKSGGEGEASIIEWALDNYPKDFNEWAYYDDKGKLQGPLSKVFEQAIRMEGTKRASGRHAAGIVISNEPLRDIVPMAYDSSTGEMIAALEMGDLEKRGQVKFDFLGIAALDKCHAAINHLRTGVLSLYND